MACCSSEIVRVRFFLARRVKNSTNIVGHGVRPASAVGFLLPRGVAITVSGVRLWSRFVLDPNVWPSVRRPSVVLRARAFGRPSGFVSAISVRRPPGVVLITVRRPASGVRTGKQEFFS